MTIQFISPGGSLRVLVPAIYDPSCVNLIALCSFMSLSRPIQYNRAVKAQEEAEAACMIAFIKEGFKLKPLERAKSPDKDLAKAIEFCTGVC